MGRAERRSVCFTEDAVGVRRIDLTARARLGYDGRVILLVDVVVEGPDRPPPGSPVHIQVRDTSMVDVEAPLLVEHTAEVASGLSSRLGCAELEIPDAELDPRRRFDVFAHVDLDANGEFTPGDFITTRSYPLPRDGAGREVRLELAVVRI
jgi:hypothetical protein